MPAQASALELRIPLPERPGRLAPKLAAHVQRIAAIPAIAAYYAAL